jgi:hypothetical protein
MNKKQSEQTETEQDSTETQNIISPPGTDQAKTAARLAATISPIIAREMMSGNICFAGLTVIVDNKYSTTFPFYPFVEEGASEQQVEECKLNNIKSDMLAAIEFSRAAGLYKNKAINSFEKGI